MSVTVDQEMDMPIIMHHIIWYMYVPQALTHLGSSGNHEGGGEQTTSQDLHTTLGDPPGANITRAYVPCQ